MELNKNALTINRVLLGLAMLLPGLLKLFVMKPEAIVGMLGGLGFPAATFFAWILILSEIVFGAAILLNWKLNYTTIPPAIILIVASFTVHWGNIPTDWSTLPAVLVHLGLASNYWLLGTGKLKSA